ncbi:MAG: sigma-70 family RNA polymerase sigma factor [Armatimonadetes bacterium]|nr:sigma-70 family RNA polymerase sigma factor [Armatimonadota bacterium]MDE2205151.1 sigma-70 family RNA polymerase sigma factor [Armatimonadota bacterium]
MTDMPAPPSQAATDEQLFHRIRKGEQRAFGELVDRYADKIYRLTRRFTQNATEAEDLSQDIFIAVYTGIPRFLGRSTPGTWIYRIAMNQCLEYRRKRRIETLPLFEEVALSAAATEAGPEQLAEKSELRRRIERALTHLSPLHQQVILLHELHELTYQEVAAMLGIPVGTVKSRLANAFQKLRPLLADCADDGDESR